MNERGQITQASLQGTPCTWSYGTDGILDEVKATGIHNYKYSFDTNTGNLDWREDEIEDLRDDFTYDNLDRLDDIVAPDDYISIYFDTKGNITSKDDAGDFEYNIANRPFQVSDIDNYTSIVDTTHQDIDYTSFSKIETITQAAYEATFKYNSDNQRVKMVLKNNGSVSKTKYYFGSSYEKVVEGSTTTEYIWIGGSPYDAVAVAKITNGGTPEIYSVYRDHLGTMTHIKSSSTTNKYSFDAWGRRRDADTWNYTLTGEPGLFADRGFTGHEHMPEFGLINMNGRVYDPVLGRFLSPDNYVQASDFTQGFNRYSYCWNNPLKYTDPSGEKFMDWFKYTNAWFIFVDAMQWINDKTPNLRSKMVEAGIPSFNAGMTIGSNESFDFNYSINGNHIYDSQENDVNQAVNNFKNDFANVQNTLAALGGNSNSRSIDRNNWKYASSQGGGPGWEAFVGAAGTAASEMYYSEKYGTWMGKNFKMYKQTWGGNGFTGGKNKFGKTTSNAIKWGGRALGAWNAYSIQRDYAAGEMGTGWMLAEQGTNAFSTLGGIYGAAWGVGWELGRGVTNMGWYQEAKFNFWYNRWENQVGAPSQSNEALWYYFYQNYKP